MASTTTRRKGGAPKSLEGTMQLMEEPQNTTSPVNNGNGNGAKPIINALTGNKLTIAKAEPPIIATVKRNKFGTGPFDEHWLNLDCCGLLCAAITYGLHAYGVYAVCVILLPPWMSETDEEGVRHMSLAGHFHRIAFTMVALFAVAAHFMAMTTDPGAVPPDAIPLDDGAPVLAAPSQDPKSDAPVPKRGKKLCRRCKSFKPKRAHHCSVCNRCIIKMDHHCPWVNNCVGIGNHKYFLLFVFYTCLSCMYSLLLVAIRFYSCMSRHGRIRTHHVACLDKPTQLLNILGLLVEAILFGMFTFCMIMDQSSVVTSKLTHIDRLKGGEDGRKGGSGDAVEGVIEVFGLSTKRGNDPRFRWDWLSPFAKACFPASIRNEIMGFCQPCGLGSKNPKHGGDLEINGSSTTRTKNNSSMVRSVAEIV